MPKKIIAEVSDTTYSKLLKKKAEDKFEDASWGEWLGFIVRGVDLNPTVTQQIHRGTRELLPLWMKNFSENLPLIKGGKTLRELIPEGDPKGRAIVIGRGPSVFRKNHLKMLADSNFDGTIVLTDGILIEALKAGVTPEKFRDIYVVSVDGSPVCEKWYNDPLVKEHAPGMSSVLCTQVSPKVTKLVVDAGFKGLHWFVPTSDRVTDKDSITKLQLLMTCGERNPNGQISMDCGGNVGAASWVLAWSILKRKEICLIGFDFGYPDDMPLEESYYFDKTVSHIGALHGKAFYEKVFHPHFKTSAWIDPPFKSYRQSFFDMLMACPDWVETANCVPSESLVRCKNGFTPIEKIKVGDEVLTHEGKFSKVLRVYNRSYQGRLITIRAVGDLASDFTPEHPILVVRSKMKKDKLGRLHHRVYPSKRKIFNTEWIPAKEVRVGDYVVYPLIKGVEDVDTIRFSSKLDLRGDNFGVTEGLGIKGTIRLDRDFCRLIGYYLAEGTATGYQTIWTFGAHEAPYINDVIRILDGAGYKPLKQETRYSTTNVVVTSRPLSTFFVQFGRTSLSKRVPHWIMTLPKDKQGELFKGYWRGDGDTEWGSFRVTSCSLNLIRNIRDLLLRIGITSMVYRSKRKKGAVIKGRQLPPQTAYQLTVSGDSLYKASQILGIRHPKISHRSASYSHLLINDDHLFSPVRKVSSQSYFGTVWNLQVEGDETFALGNLTIHNCTGGGTLYYPPCLKCQPFEEWLSGGQH